MFDLKFNVNKETIQHIIDTVYVDGKIKNESNYSYVITTEDPLFNDLLDQNNITVNLYNEEIMHGFMKFIVQTSSEEIRLIPINVYYLKESDTRYSFY